MAPTTRSLKTDPKKEENNISPLKLDDKLSHLSPKTTLPTKLPLTHSTNDILNFDVMDKEIMEILQKQENMLQYNKQKLQDFELKCNSMNSTFKHFASKNHDNFEFILNCIDKVENNILANNKNHQNLHDKMT